MAGNRGFTMATTLCNQDPAAALSAEAAQRIRERKVRRIRRRLGEGRYDLAKRLDAVADKLLEDLLR